MPAAKKKPATRRATRTRSRPSSNSQITRKEVERATAQIDKALEEASAALQTLGADLGKGAMSAYKEVEKALKALRRDAQRTNKTLLKDLDKLMGVATSRAASRSTTRRSTAGRAAAKPRARSAATKSGSRSAATKTTTAKSTAARKPARKSTTSRSRAAAKKPASRRSS